MPTAARYHVGKERKGQFPLYSIGYDQTRRRRTYGFIDLFPSRAEALQRAKSLNDTAALAAEAEALLEADAEMVPA
jgi:hypothetical protein